MFVEKVGISYQVQNAGNKKVSELLIMTSPHNNNTYANNIFVH